MPWQVAESPLPEVFLEMCRCGTETQFSGGSGSTGLTVGLDLKGLFPA